MYTARVVDGPEADAAGGNRDRVATPRCKSFSNSKPSASPISTGPRSTSYELHTRPVRVRLFYRDGNRQFPASREMKIPVRYVLGRYVDDSVECFLTDYDIVFHCPAMRELPQLIDEAVRNAAAQIGSRELVAATPPADSELRIVRVRLKERRFQLDSDTDRRLGDRCRSGGQNATQTQDRRRSSIATTKSAKLLDGDEGCQRDVGGHRRLRQNHHHQTCCRPSPSRRPSDRQSHWGNPPPPPLVWESSAENLIAGMQYLGEWEQRLEQVIAQLEAIGGVLFLSSQIDLVRLGGTQPTDSLAAFLMPYVRRGEMRLITETTPDELDAARRLLPGWAECFQILRVAAADTSADPRYCRDDVAGCRPQSSDRRGGHSGRDRRHDCFAQFMPYQSPPKGVVQLIADVIEETTRQSTSAPVNRIARQRPRGSAAADGRWSAAGRSASPADSHVIDRRAFHQVDGIARSHVARLTDTAQHSKSSNGWSRT